MSSSGKYKYQGKYSGEPKDRIHYYNHHNAFYHPNSRRFNYNYHHYNSNNTYNNYNNSYYYSNNNSNNNNPYYGQNHFYNNHIHQPYNNLPPPPLPATSSVTSPMQSPQPRITVSSNSLQNGSFLPQTPTSSVHMKVNSYIDYWTNPVVFENENESEFSSDSVASSSSDSIGNTFFSFPSKRSQNGCTTAKALEAPNLMKADSPSPSPFSSNGYASYQKVQENANGADNKDKELKLRGKYYLDGYCDLSRSDIDAEEMVKAFKFGEVLERPDNVAPEGSSWADLSEAIWEKFTSNQQTTEIFRKKMELWRDMCDSLRLISRCYRHYRHFGLQVVGSTMSGFGSSTSDVDMCLLVRRADVDQQSEAVDLLHQFWAAMGKPSYLDRIEMIYAKIPLLKCRDPLRNLEVDLNCNNSVGVRNTHLLYCYAQQDWRLKPLALVVKLWAKFHDINDAKSMTISSYSLVLMVIHFLQCGVTPPVLHCLHKLYPAKFTFYQDVAKLRFVMNEDIEVEKSLNTQTLGELLVKFFEYYAIQFDYKMYAISVRQGSVMPIRMCQLNRSHKNDHSQWKHLCIEEPFDYTNTARSVYDRDTFDRIRGIFFASWQRLMLSGDLESIFTPISAFEARQIGLKIRSGTA